MTISYAVEPYEITTLTWPMWEACGIECPAMIGADCPGKEGDGLKCPGWSAKYSSAAAEVAHGWTMTSDQSEECGTTEFGGNWYALFRNPDKGTFDGPMGAGLILTVTDQGFVSLIRYTDGYECDQAWKALEAETHECPHESPICTPDALCDACEEDF
jgi:hypothetical protein